jgi:imidazolonepropionase-like amidohydrolase
VSYLLRACREAAGDRQTFDLRYDGGVVIARGALEPEAGDQVVDLGGAFVSPGLIDVHVHLGLGGPPEAAARASVVVGLTAVRDLGGLRRTDPHGPQDASGPQDAPGPPDGWGPPGAWGLPLRVVSAGRALTRKGGYGAFLGVAVSDRAELLAAAQVEVGRGAATLKVIVSGVVDFAAGTVGAPYFDKEDLRELVAYAGHAGVPVAAHANGAEAIGMAVAAGVDSVEHGILVSEAELLAMAAAGTRWVPTLTPLHNLRGDPRWPRVAEIFGRHLEAVARGRELGVTLVAGSDAGSPRVPHGSLHVEVGLLRLAGLSGPEVRRAATSAAAELLALGSGYGRLEVGARTDLVWFAEDPFLDAPDARPGALGVVTGAAGIGFPAAVV